MNTKTIGIVGYGYVGKAMAEFFRSHYPVKVYDIAGPSTDGSRPNLTFVKNLKALESCDLAVVCVSTPPKADGSCDVSAVDQTVRELKTPLILVKSTVPPGTCKRLMMETCKNIVFSPEFSGENKYISPYGFDKEVKRCPFYIFGGNRFLVDLMVDLIAPITGPHKKYAYTDSTTAELVKYWENTFLALKVTFCNEMFEICNRMNISYWEARDLWLLDPRMGESHTAVFINERGYAGKCLPKDTKALRAACRAVGYEPKLIDCMIKRNEDFNALTDELVPAKLVGRILINSS